MKANQVKKLWEEFRKIPFPKEIHSLNTDFEFNDSLAAGCISSFVEYGKLSKENKQVLLGCKKYFKENMNKLPPEGKKYFEKLLKIIDCIL